MNIWTDFGLYVKINDFHFSHTLTRTHTYQKKSKHFYRHDYIKSTLALYQDINIA